MIILKNNLYTNGIIQKIQCYMILEKDENILKSKLLHAN